MGVGRRLGRFRSEENVKWFRGVFVRKYQYFNGVPMDFVEHLVVCLLSVGKVCAQFGEMGVLIERMGCHPPAKSEQWVK